MYLAYWGLERFPFDNVADPSFFFLSEIHKEALSRLLYASKMMKGGAMLTGDIGCGKTLISRVYMSRLQQHGSEVSLLTNPPLEPVELLQEILVQMNVAEVGNSKTKLLQTLNRRIRENMEQRKETIIIIDEAQILNEETFEEARLLLNMQSNDRFLLTVVLIGQTELKVKIRQMNQFDQRIVIRYHIHPFGLPDTIKYIMFRERKAGFQRNVFTTKAIERIHEYSRGVPRVINSVCDLCLLIGFDRKSETVHSGIVNSVLEELA
jgi:type II secretory pathway predicted ATPase ExeA